MPADISFTVITAAEAPGSTSSMLIALEKTAGRLVPGGVVVILGCGTDSDRHSTNIPELYVTTAADRSAALAVARAFVGTRDMLDLKATDNVCVVKRRSSVDVYGNESGACVQWQWQSDPHVYPSPLLAVIGHCSMCALVWPCMFAFQ